LPLFKLRFHINIILLSVVFIVNDTDSAFALRSDDSLMSVKTHFQSSIGLSLMAGRDPAGFIERMININSRSELHRSIVKAHKNSEIKIRHELGYTGIADSIWIKNNDLLHLNYDLLSGAGPVQHHFRIEFETGILNDYESIIDPATGTSFRELSSAFLNPASIETGYGFSLKPNPYYDLGFSLSTAKFRTLPVNNNQSATQGIEFARLNNAIVIFHYGFSLQLSYLRTLSNQIEVIGNGNLFIKGLKKDDLEGEASLQVTFKLTQWLQVRMFSKIDHDRALGQKTRYRTEILTGLYYENNR